MAVSDGFERGLQVGMRVDAVHFCRFDQRADAGPGRGTFVMAGEQRVLAVQRQRPDGVLTTLESISTRPSSRNTCSPFQ